jgi:hypothetical protein
MHRTNRIIATATSAKFVMIPGKDVVLLLYKPMGML